MGEEKRERGNRKEEESQESWDGELEESKHDTTRSRQSHKGRMCNLVVDIGPKDQLHYV